MKTKLAFILLTALVLFCSASPWEGAAVTAPEGELPEKGRYVATNSFPRNTIVDIINIETNKSTRAIVAGGLESPGLLALISREAADLIGMHSGSVSRIRMTQPSDPIAYLRFRDGAASGIPDYDSGNVMTEERYREEWYREEAAGSTPPVIAKELPPYLLEPEWEGGKSRDIIDLPVIIPPANDEEVAWLREEEEKIEIVEYIPEPPPEEVIEIVVEEPEEIEVIELVEEEPEEIEEIVLVEDEPEPEPEEIVLVEEEPEPEPEEVVQEELPETEEALGVEYYLVEDEERPPVGDIYGIDPSSIIPGITITEAIPEQEPVISVVEAAPGPVVTDERFSVQRIYNLERGKYYVQLAALDSPELVESTVHDVDRSYNPVVYKDGDHWYRVLLGPLNQGESAAVLKRFKSIGYKDAFVRHAR